MHLSTQLTNYMKIYYFYSIYTFSNINIQKTLNKHLMLKTAAMKTKLLNGRPKLCIK